MTNQNKNIYWINAVKALSVIAVFFVHCQLYYLRKELSINCWIYPWYVNAFFFVSGYLLFWKQLSFPKIDEDFRTYIMGGSGKVMIFNIFYRIVIPSIIFSIIEFVPSCLIQGRDINISFALYKTLGGGTYWFTSALVIAELILFICFCTRNRNIWFYVIVSLILGLLGLSIVHLGVLQSGVWAWRQGLISLIFLSLGGLYWRYERQIDKLIHWWFVIPLFGVFIVLIFFCHNTNPLISTLDIQPLGFLTSAISCILLVWLCKRLPNSKQLTFIGQNSLGFYFLSGALPIPIGLLMNKCMATMCLHFTDLQSMLILIVMWIGCVALAYWTVSIINRWLPWLWDLRSKEKKD